MQIISLYLNLALASVLLYFCDGAPPQQSAPSSTRERRYTEQEHDLVYKMLESLAGSYDPSIWNKIQKAHEEKLKANVDGFSMPRSIKSLREHFVKTLNRTKIKVPDSLRVLYEKMKKTAITRQEQDFMNTEMMRPEYDSLSLFSEKRWADIKKKHDKKRESGEQGFANKRTGRVLRNHFKVVMMPKNLVLEPIKRKFPDYFNTKEDELVNEIGDGPSENVYQHYSDQEHELLFKILDSNTLEGAHNPSVWKEIKKAFEEKRKDKATGFSIPRTIKSLQRHLITIVNRDKVEVSPALRERCDQVKRNFITREEEDLINRELLRTDLPAWRLNSIKRWKKIEESHDKARESKTPGIACKRSWYTLRGHFYYVMKSKNLVDEAVMKRFPRLEAYQGAPCFEEGEQSDTDPGENLDCRSDEEDEVWVDEYGVDHTLFVDPVDGNGFYMDDSPYEHRRF